MKQVLLLVMLLATSLLHGQDTVFYVAAKAGLNIREKPEISSRLVDKIPYGSRITISDGENLGIIRVENFNGNWKKVTYNQKTGYIIDVYLLPVPPPSAGTKTLKDYLGQLSVTFGEKLVITRGSESEGSSATLTKQLYKNGGEWHEYAGYEYSSMTYFLPGFTMQQAFLLARLIPEFSNCIGEKEEFILESKKIRKGGREYEYKVEKEVFGNTPWVNRIRIDFEEGALYHFEIYQIDDQVIIFYGSGV